MCSDIAIVSTRIDQIAINLWKLAGQPVADGAVCVAYSHLQLAYGMTQLSIIYKDYAHQLNEMLLDEPSKKGNPSLVLQTMESGKKPAIYHHDPDTSIIVVNEYPFYASEVTPLTSDDRIRLRKSLATEYIASCSDGGYSGFDRKLTLNGMYRLAADLQRLLDCLNRDE